MNIKEYIQSGIIESYVLGLSDAEEVAAIEALRKQHPEINEAIMAFENELEQAAVQNAVRVNTAVKTELFAQLNLNPPTENSNIDADKTSTTIPLTPISSKPFFKYLAAASVILFVVSLGINFYTYSKYKNLQAENRQLTLQRNQLFTNNGTIQTRLNELNNNIQLISDPNVIKIALDGVAGKETNKAVVYWNKSKKDVYIIAETLPQAPKGKQYQLWALLDGKPIDAGVLDNCNSICKLKNIENAQAFAITLEKEGGSPTPTLEQLYVMGKIS